MKTTKKEIYASYNIEYVNGKIKTPDGDLINPLLKKGNTKTGEKIFTYSQLAGCHTWNTELGTIKGTCSGTCPNCYACTGFFKTPSTKKSLAINTIITRSNINFKIAAIIAQIKADNISIVRIHAAGDFDSISDVNAWDEISKACPDTLFYTYTKRAWDDIDTLNNNSNVNIVPSIIGDRFNFGTCSELIELKNICPTAYICPCGFTETHCQDCKACAINKNVIFLLHSTPDYNGEDDPLYMELKAIVENQTGGVENVK